MQLSRAAVAVALASLAGCATATPRAADDDDDDIDARGAVIDAPPGTVDAPPGTIDARVIDAPPGAIDAAVDAPTTTQSVTLSQTTSAVAGNAPACNDALGNFENSFYRVFALTDFGVTTTFTANRIDFGVGEVAAGNLISQPVDLRIYRLTGTFIIPNLQLLGSATTSVPDSATNTVRQVPITAVVPAGSTIVAEIHVPDAFVTGDLFFPGSSAAAETAAGYVMAADCAITSPSTFAAIGFPTAHLVLTVTGTY